jgi:hypothetical protein
MSQSASTFLPGLFRKRRTTDPDVIVNPDPPNIAAPVEPAPAPMPVQGPPNVLAPISPTTGQPMDESATRPRRVETDERGRPIPQVNAIDPDQRALEYNQRLNAYTPEEAHGFKDRFLKPILSAAVKGLRYGPGGAAGAALEQSVASAVDPKQPSRQWKTRELAESNQQVAGINAQRKMAAQQAQANATLAKTGVDTALTLKKLNAPEKATPGSVHQNANGDWVLVDRVSGTSKPVTDQDGKALKGKPTGIDKEWVVGDDGIAKLYKNGVDSGLRDVKRNLIKAPDGSFVSPNTKYAADIAAGKGASQGQLENDALARNISDAQAEQAKIDEGLKNTPPTIQTTDIFGAVKTVQNPAYEQGMRRRQALDDDIRGWRAHKKSVAKPSTGTAPNANDPLGLGLP